MGKKRKNMVYIVREVRVDSYGTFTTTEEMIHPCETYETAIEEVSRIADLFEEIETNGIIGKVADNVKCIRLCDEDDVKILFSRTFDKRYSLDTLREIRVFIHKQELIN